MNTRQKTRKVVCSRRRFLHRSVLTLGAAVIPASALGRRTSAAADGGKRSAANERLNIAGIGLGVRGLGNLKKCDDVNIVAVCDVDTKLAAVAFREFPDAPKYQDYRKLLDEHPEIDGVIISTPDHTHAVIAAEAMRRGKHVYLETPLAHDVWEARQLARLAAETGVITQMGIERHSSTGIRQAVEMLWGGGLGPIREVHCWSNRPQWPQGIGRPAGSTPPAGLLWDLWLGPAPARAFDRAYHPYRWRGWLDFGGGALGAMGCQLLDVAFWGLNLDEVKSFTVTAESTGVNGETYPEASTVRYEFPARGEDPPVSITWYDGGRLPPEPEPLPPHRGLGSNGILFLGEEHPMMFGPTVFGTNPGQVGPRTLPEYLQITNRRPVKKIPEVPQGTWTRGDRHILEWLTACKSGKQPCANFGYSSQLTEMVLLGNVALQVGAPIVWDAEKLEVTNVAEANSLIRRPYRKGWTL